MTEQKTALKFLRENLDKKGFDDLFNVFTYTQSTEEMEYIISEVMKEYALSVRPDELEESTSTTEDQYAFTVGWNDCIDKITKNIS